MGLSEEDHDVCLRAIRDHYPRCEVEEIEEQGYCSFTVTVTYRENNSFFDPIATNGASASDEWPERCVVQIRPQQHSMDVSITRAARDTYGQLAPCIQYLDCCLPLGLQAFEMDLLTGIAYSSCQPKTQILDAEAWDKQINLIRSFASFVAKAWPLTPTSSNHGQTCRSIRADSPITDSPIPAGGLHQCLGKVGTQILFKLGKLARELPDSALRQRAAQVLSGIKQMFNHPVVLNHGDLIPSNILVNSSSGEIEGIVDWAEAEYLPFGTCLYGLEHLVGYLDTCTSTSATTYNPKFMYYNRANELREVFWTELREQIPDLRDEKEMEQVRIMRDMGVLLWYGYAWDEGRIDRVVNEVADAVELEYLKKFLGYQVSS